VVTLYNHVAVCFCVATGGYHVCKEATCPYRTSDKNTCEVSCALTGLTFGGRIEDAARGEFVDDKYVATSSVISYCSSVNAANRMRTHATTNRIRDVEATLQKHCVTVLGDMQCEEHVRDGIIERQTTLCLRIWRLVQVLVAFDHTRPAAHLRRYRDAASINRDLLPFVMAVATMATDKCTAAKQTNRTLLPRDAALVQHVGTLLSPSRLSLLLPTKRIRAKTAAMHVISTVLHLAARTGALFEAKMYFRGAEAGCKFAGTFEAHVQST